MALWLAVRSFWRNVVHRSDMERDMAEELQFHIERRAEDLVAAPRPLAGRSHADRAARVRIRGEVQGRGAAEPRPAGWSTNCAATCDMRCARFGRSKGFTAAAIATLALGIGANTAMFSVIDALLLRELPVKNPEALVVFDWLRAPDSMVAAYSGYGRPGPGPGLGVRTSFSALTVERFRQHSATLSDVFAFSPTGTLNIVADRQAETASGLFVTGRVLAGLGIQGQRRAHLVSV